MDALIKIKNISKSYDSNEVLRDISFEMKPGSFYSVLGLNGSGKSTLLNILGNRISKDSSEGEILGVPLGEDLSGLRNQIGFVSEKLNLGAQYKPKDLVNIYQNSFTNWDEEYFQYLLRKRNFDINKEFSEYSRGQRMQFFLILCLAYRPTIFFLDEITSVLDYKARDFFLNELNKITEAGGLVVISTNIVSEINHNTTDLMIIQDKKLVFDGKKDSLFNNFCKLKFPPQANINFTKKSLNLGLDQEGSTNLLVRVEELNENFEKYIDPTPVNLGEIFAYITDSSFDEISEAS